MRRYEKLTGIFSLLLFCYILTGCNREAGDKLLRTFIDGVPSAKEEKPAAAEEKENKKPGAKIEAALPKAPTQFVHPPFSENQCDSCHDSKFSQKLVAKGKELCFICHDDFTKGKAAVHYPVGEGACTECHDPHQSPNKFILKKPVPEICFACHDVQEIKAVSVHEDQSACADCHDAHASNEEKLLK